MKFRWSAAAAAALSLFLFVPGADAAGVSIPLLDRLAESHGTAKISLATGAVSFKVTLAPLPALIDTGTSQFEATIYKAYVASSTDPAAEVPLGNLWPSAKGTAALKTALKGDLSHLGFDRVLVVAYSKDGLSSFDVLTATLPAQ